MSHPPKRKPRRDAGRPRGEPIAEAVLMQALEELAVHGIESFSIERIARAADVNKTTVYRRWPTRDALVAAALERVLRDVSVQVADTGSLRGDLRLLAKTIAAFIDQPSGRALARAAFAESGAPAIVELATRQIASQADEPVRAMLKRARERGEWRTGVPPEVLLSTLVGSILHRVMLELQPASSAWLTKLIDLLLHGVTPLRMPASRASS